METSLSDNTVYKLQILRQMYINSGLRDTHIFPDGVRLNDLSRLDNWIRNDDTWVERVVMQFANVLYKHLKGLK